jgi:hypothetical protein
MGRRQVVKSLSMRVGFLEHAAMRHGTLRAVWRFKMRRVSVGGHMSDQFPRHEAGAPELDTTRARQGVTGHNVRYVLLLGLIGVVIVFALAYLGVFGA